MNAVQSSLRAQLHRVKRRLSESPLVRRVYAGTAAKAYLTAFSFPPIRDKVAPHLTGVRPSPLYSPSGRGLDPNSELRALDRLGLLHGKSVLIIGVGGGDEILSWWLATGVRHIVAIDLVRHIDFKQSIGWTAVAHTAQSAGLKVQFAQGDGNRLPFVDGAFDLVYTISVLEHVADLETFLGETARVLRSGGTVYSYFGPLWFTYGGPHVGSLAYEHLLLPYGEFLDKVREIGEPWQVRWAEQHFYNRLTLPGYVDIFQRYFHIRRLAVVGSPPGQRYKRDHPDEWRELSGRYGEPALVTNLASIVATKRGGDDVCCE